MVHPVAPLSSYSAAHYMDFLCINDDDVDLVEIELILRCLNAFCVILSTGST